MEIRKQKTEVKKKKKVKHCNNCGKVAVVYDRDPMLEEIYPEVRNKYEWWCRSCYQERLYDI